VTLLAIVWVALLATYCASCATSAHQLLCRSLVRLYFLHHLCLVTGVELTVTASAAVVRKVGLFEERNSLEPISLLKLLCCFLVWRLGQPKSDITPVPIIST